MTRFRDTFDFMDDARRERTRFGDNEARDGAAEKSDLVDLDLVLLHATASGYKLSPDGTQARAAWLPKAHAEIAATGNSVMGEGLRGQRTLLPLVRATVPQWLAKQKGLL